VVLDKRPLKNRETFFLLKYMGSFAAGKTSAVKADINDSIITEGIQSAASVVSSRTLDMTAFAVYSYLCNDNGNIVSVPLSEISETIKNMINKPQLKQSKVVQFIIANDE